MKRIFSWGKFFVITALVIAVSGTAHAVFAQGGSAGANKESGPAMNCKKDQQLCLAPYFSKPSDQLKALTAPPIASGTIRTVNYSVATKGQLKSSFEDFKKLANETLNSPLGWSRLGVTFKEVASGGDFTLFLSQASEVPGFSSGCDSTYSCNVGRFVIINEDRWLGATDSWNQGGGSLRDYRHMVVNHETGHWLGQGHESCPGPGQPAPVMQQQSISLQGCSFNPWPVASEIYSPRLGI